MPFLDHRLVEFAFSLPDALCLTRDGSSKYLVRRYLEKHRMTHVLNMPKRGFNIPYTRLLPAEGLAREVLNGNMARDGFVSPEALNRHVELYLRQGAWLKIWLLALLEEWYRHWYLGGGLDGASA